MNLLKKQNAIFIINNLLSGQNFVFLFLAKNFTLTFQRNQHEYFIFGINLDNFFLKKPLKSKNTPFHSAETVHPYSLNLADCRLLAV